AYATSSAGELLTHSRPAPPQRLRRSILCESIGPAILPATFHLMRGHRMIRRHFIALVSAGMAVSALRAQAQQSDKVWRIGFIAHKHENFYEPLFGRLRELGYEGGRNLIVERRYAQGHADRFQELSGEVVRVC